MKKLNKTREMLVEEFKKALTEEKGHWTQGWSSPELPKNALSSRKYNGVNRTLLYLVSCASKYDDPRWCTFNQAKKEGWRVKKGEHGVPIEYWYLYDKKNKCSIDQKTANEEIAKDKNREKDIFWTSRTYTVFNGKQLDGIPEYKPPKTEWQEQTYTDFTMSVIGALGVGYYEDSSSAYYLPKKDEIHIPEKSKFFNEYEFASTVLHECSHASMDSRRLNYEFGSTGFGSEGYAREELVAEMSSAFLCADLGLEMSKDHMDNHSAYVQGWLSELENNPEILFESIAKAEKVCEYVEEKGEIEKFIEDIELEEEKQK